ncbi:hypothetical protein TNCV_188601 [Trichonephila clavipes]|nr:hypothetical protein TNCV_188601 [Trichonephila clavipes]
MSGSPRFREDRESIPDNPLAKDRRPPSVTKTLRNFRQHCLRKHPLYCEGQGYTNLHIPSRGVALDSRNKVNATAELRCRHRYPSSYSRELVASVFKSWVRAQMPLKYQRVEGIVLVKSGEVQCLPVGMVGKLRGGASSDAFVT